MQDYQHMNGGLGSGGSRVHTKQFNSPFEVIPIVVDTAVHKAKFTWDQLLILGFISGSNIFSFLFIFIFLIC